MFSRTLLVALCIVYATPLTPLSTQGDDDCALYLTGPGRSSAYDYSLNLLKGNFAYDGQHTCITYEAINQAYLDARTRILVSQPKGDWKAENFASVGELLLDVSISLARIYGLTYEEIEKGLPLIDTSRTLIREVCPPVFSHVECRAGKYRRLDGLCNNLRHPTWGATMAPFQRLIGPLFADGINAPRISHTGRDLPLSRVVSRTMHPDDGFHDHAGTVMVIAWGQFMDHDYTLTGTPLDPVHRNDPEECCKRPPHLKHPYCNEIRVPDDDYFYRLFGVKCIDFVRGFPSPRPGCRLGSRAPFNTLTGAIDGNTVYGVTEKFARKLRTGYSGLLRMNPVFKEYGLKDLLPLKLDIPDEGCTRPNKNMFCFEAGEIRVNEQLVLTVMHTLMAREHNRVAEALATVNPHWDDETLFQESRRINIAEIQHITYNEFLPILLGKDVMEKFGLVLEKQGYWDGYDENVNPDVIASFAAAAYRFGHSLLPTAVERWSKAHKFIASKRLSDLIRRPYDLYRAGVLDEYVMGLMNQVAQAMDDSITQEVTNHLFKKVGARFGMDLVSFNMQRGREFGLPGYMEFRKFCGLSGADSFQDLFGSMANETIQKYESIFEHPIDVDLWSGGVSERPLPGSMLGPTFACIIATQFSYSRRGDRFWFELPNQPSSFTPEQIVELRKARLARVICDNTDIIDTVQLYPMVLPDHELNPRVPCRSGVIPSMDFSKWAEPQPFLGGAKEYMTEAHIYNQTQDHKNIEMERDDCTTDDASNKFMEQEDCKNDDLVIVAIRDDKNKQNKTETEPKTSDSFEQNCENVGGNTANEQTHRVKDSDSVLKYVYTKTDINASNKTKGHAKNSLKRKKRSVISDSEIQTHRQPRKFQINDQADREEIAVPPTKAQGIINKDDLADFNIETLHENIKPSIDILMKDSKGYVNNRRKNKKYGRDESKNNEHVDKSNINIKSTNVNNEPENNEHNKNDKKNIETEHDRDIINDYIDESISVENNSNEYIENGRERLPQKVDDGSSEYIENDSRNVKDDSFSGHDSLNDYIKEPKNDNNESREYEIKDRRNINSDSFNKDGKRNDYTKEPKNDNNESNEYEIKDRRNIKSDSFNKDGRHNDYTKESKNDNNESNEHEIKGRINIKSDSFNKDYRRNDYTKESKNDDIESNEHEIKGRRDIKSDFFNTKEPKNDNIESKEYEIKGRKNIRSDSFNRHNDYPKESKNDNNESNEHEINDRRNLKNDFFNKDDKRNDYSKEPKNDNNEGNEHEIKDRIYINSDSFNKDDRRNDYTKESTNDNNDSKEYKIKDKKNIRSNSFNKDDIGNDYTKESKNDDYESNEREIKDRRNIKSDPFNKDDKRNNYSKESKNDNNESNEREIKKNRNVKTTSLNKDDVRNDYTKESRNYEKESDQYEVKDRTNINSSDNVNHNRKKQYTNSNEESKEDYLTDYKEPLKNEKGFDGDSFEKSIPILRNKVINKNLDLFKKQLANNDSEIISHEDLKATSYESNENINDVKEKKLLNKDKEGGFAANKKRNHSVNFDEVDLDDFSYESIQDEKDESISPIINLNKINESTSLAENVAVLPNTLEKPFTGTNSKNTPLISNAFKNEKQIKINDDEIKPVKELNNSEYQSEEESKEYKESEQSEDKEQSINDHLKSVIEKSHKFHPISKKVDEKENTDVKAQFERIPQNYVHTEVESNTTEKKPVVENIDGEGTLDAFTPNNYEYDKDLNIKFGDITIKLPEIKLPKDILSYAREETNNHKKDYDKSEDRENVNSEDKEEDNSEDSENKEDQEEDEELEEYNKEPKDNKENREDFYQSYFGPPSADLSKDNPHTKEKYSNFHNEHSGEDLYEKFVRERFGKKNDLKKRSEKLINYDLNKPVLKDYNLYKNVRKALKKAKKVEKEAEKSKDPNYMWTLEYGGKL